MAYYPTILVEFSPPDKIMASGIDSYVDVLNFSLPSPSTVFVSTVDLSSMSPVKIDPSTLFESQEPTGTPVFGYFSGYVFEDGTASSRTVYLHKRFDGSLEDTVVSNESGYYYLETTSSGSHYIVCLDDEAGKDYNDLIIGGVYPTTILG